jgi:hypothetical protein
MERDQSVEECTVLVKRGWVGRHAIISAGITFSAIGVIGIVVSAVFITYSVAHLPQIAAGVIACFILDKILFFIAAWGDATHQFKHTESVPYGTLKNILNKEVRINVRFTTKISDPLQESSAPDEYSSVAATNHNDE